MGKMLIFLASFLSQAFQAPLRLRYIIKEMHFIGVRSLFVIVLTASFTGMVLGLQGYYTLRQLGSEGLLGSAVALSLIRELGPVLAAIMVTARAGSAIAAEIGTIMKMIQCTRLECKEVKCTEVMVSHNIKEVLKLSDKVAMLHEGIIVESTTPEEMAKRSLARHWKKRSDIEKKEFVAIFTDLIEGSYIEKIEAYTDEEILYTGEKIDGRRAVVKTRIISKGTEIPIYYRLLESKDGNWMVYDIVIEGVSLIGNYRTQFSKIIRGSSYEELVKKIKAKLEKR
ncbi:MAG: ABC transporter substrate-binding protein [Thermodesulfobacteriota bacterium]